MAGVYQPDKFEVFLGTNKIDFGEILPYEKTQFYPKIYVNKDLHKIYCIIMIDADAPYPENPLYKYRLHYLVANNEEILSYEKPKPPIDSDYHRYYFYLLEQKDYIQIDANDIPRSKFDFIAFVKKYNLEIKNATFFKTKRSVH